ncbi:guanylate kinase [Aquisediminimonas sediminicola]|uniref:guanylate kinase n=1 Tax=Alteraquisediminimonas sediminicola TaxID=2676787 RepID=UPI001C8DCAFD|nr:guanylate kinase [Aquisediminimonas sediminicola]
MQDTSNPIRRRGLLFVLSSPSGAGKSTISRMLLETDQEIRMSVSATTRAMRPGEEDGVHYHFLTPEKFEDMEKANQFLEWAHVFGNRYGTPRAGVEQIISDGRDVLFDIDWQGTQQLHATAGDDLVRVFILPPSMAELERRLRGRGTDSDDVIQGRMDRAAGEISHWAEYDYVLVNDDAASCLEKVRHILAAERLKRARNIGLVDFVRGMIG